MLDRFYSIDVLAYRIKEGDIFIGAYTGNKLIGYISYSVTGEYEYFIHKLYVDIDTHHKGIGRALFRHVFDDKKVNAVRLTVNRKNYKAVNFYFRIGFIIEDVIDIDIENGFFMNDFVMFYK